MYLVWSLILTSNFLGSIAKVFSETVDDPDFAHTTPVYLVSNYIQDSYYWW